MKKLLSSVLFPFVFLVATPVWATPGNVTDGAPNTGLQSDFQNPELTATVINEVGVQLTFIDHSDQDRYYDIRRTSPGDPVVTYQKTLVTPGTGGLYVFFDYTVQPNTTYTYTVTATLDQEGYPEYPDVASATVNTADRNPLDYPTFGSYFGIQLTETSFTFRYNNPTPGALTEIYHALAKDGPYTLLHTATEQDGVYTDSGLEPGTTYHYTLRSVLDGAVSAFAGQPQITTFKDFKLPDFSAVALPDTSVQITIHDRGLSDVRYELIREDLTAGNGELIQVFEIPDSGTTVTYFDETAMAGKTYHYILDVFLEQGNGGTVGFDTVQTVGDYALQTPYFDYSQPPSSFPCGREVLVMYSNPNLGAYTEIWRATSQDGVYALVTTDAGGEYHDFDVLPHRTYYYKLRAVDENGNYSGFSDPMALESGSDFFDPVVSATLLPDNTVQVSIVDNSYLDGSYEVYGYDRTTGLLNGFFWTLVAPDSGGIHSMVDTNVEPGHEYFYGVSAILKCDGFPVVSEFGAAITIPDGPRVSGFTLIDPASDASAGALTDGTVLTRSDLNIQADANSLTGSVVFTLDGKRNVDSTQPFALFAESKGDYKKGHLKNGTHTLTATPYSGANGTGTAGTTLSVSFTVDSQKGNAVTLYPSPVVDQSALQITGPVGSPVRVQVFDQSGNPVRSLYQGTLDGEGSLTRSLHASEFRPGIYILSVDINGNVSTMRFSVN